MARTDTTVTIGADISQLRRDLAKLPNLSDKAAQKTLIALEKTVKKAEKASKKAIKSTSKAVQQAARATEKAARDAEEGMKGLVELGGTSADKFDKLKKVVVAMGSPIGAMTIATTAATASIIGMSVAIVKAVRAADELSKSLAPFEELEGFEGLSPEAIASIETANAAMDSIAVVAQRAVLVIGSEFAPVIEDATRVLLKFGLMGLDSIKKVGIDGKTIMSDFAVFLTTNVISAFTQQADALMGMVSAMGGLASVLGDDEIAHKMQKVADSWESTKQGWAEIAVDSWIGAASDALEGLGDETKDYDAIIDGLISKSKQLAAAQHNTAAATKDAAKAAEDAARAQEAHIKALDKAAAIVASASSARLTEAERINTAEQQVVADLLATEVASQEQILAVSAEFTQRRIDLRHREAEEAAKDAEAAAAETLRMEQAYMGATSTLLGATAGALEQIGAVMGQENEDAARRAFALAKIAAVGEIGINTAQAITSVWAKWAANPPLATALSIAAAGVGATQAAAVAAQQPKFHTGGIVRAPDEVSATLLTGESVLNRSATARLGEQGVNQLNQGAATQQPLVIVQKYQHRSFAPFFEDHAKISQSTRQILKAKRTTGRR